jgi:hypothetical protein
LSAPKASKSNREIVSIIHCHDDQSLTEKDVLTLLDELKKVKSPKDSTHIDLLLNSPGGDIHAAYMMVCVLRSRCKSMNVVVPHYAKSAGTLMCLGADKIYMGQHSELGPLDAPIEHPLGKGIRLSALDGIKPLELLSEFSEELVINKMGLAIRGQVGLGRQESISLALGFVADFLEPIMAQLDPLLINMCYRYLEIAQKYGCELLERYMLKGKPHSHEEAARTIKELVWNYPEHGYAISIQEAKRIGLIVDEVESLSEWPVLWDYYKAKEEIGGTYIHVITKEISARKSQKSK